MKKRKMGLIGLIIILTLVFANTSYAASNIKPGTEKAREINFLDKDYLKNLSPTDYEIIGFTNLNHDRISIQKTQKKQNSDFVIYTVQPGDSLFRIARFYHTSITVIKELNRLTSEMLFIGQELLVPNPDSDENTRENQNDIYIVKPGDSLYQIARRYDTTVPKLKDLNRLTSEVLFIGQKLLVPKPASGTDENKQDNHGNQIYTVQPGDSLYQIARRFDTTVTKLKELNGLQSEMLFIGQKLIISLPENKTDFPGDGLPDNSNLTVVYFVQPGDSLFLIARKFNTTVDNLRTINNINTNSLFIGEKLFITPPSPEMTHVVYYVQPGDNINLIASKFHVTIQGIKEVNGLTSDMLLINQKLIIKLPIIDKSKYNLILSYRVEVDDNLLKIARKFDVSSWEIKQYNRLKYDVVNAGQYLSIPFSIPANQESENTVISDQELKLLARAVYSEARGEPFAGQVAVAAVILNRIKSPLFPNTIRDVIFQPYQFSAVDDGQFWLEPNQQSYVAARAALKGWDPSLGAIYYYNPNTAESRWIYYRDVIIRIGDHFFAVSV